MASSLTPVTTVVCSVPSHFYHSIPLLCHIVICCRGRCSASCSIPFAQTCESQSGLKPLASPHYHYCILTRTPLQYSAVALDQGDPPALVLQDQTAHMLQQLIDGTDVLKGQFKVLDLGLGGRRVGQMEFLPVFSS